MSNVKRKTGFPEPPYTQVPNIIFEAMHELSNSELRVIMAAIREIVGWHKQNQGPQSMSLSWFRKHTGMSNKGVRDGLNGIIERGWIEQSEKRGKRGVALYELCFIEGDSTTETASDYEPQEQSTMNLRNIVPLTSGTPFKETTLKETPVKEKAAAAAALTEQNGGTMREAAEQRVYDAIHGNMGQTVTPMVAEDIRDYLADGCPPEWMVDAIKEAVDHNARTWKYVKTIIDRWLKEGRGDKPKVAPTKASDLYVAIPPKPLDPNDYLVIPEPPKPDEVNS